MDAGWRKENDKIVVVVEVEADQVKEGHWNVTGHKGKCRYQLTCSYMRNYMNYTVYSTHEEEEEHNKTKKEHTAEDLLPPTSLI